MLSHVMLFIACALAMHYAYSSCSSSNIIAPDNEYKHPAALDDTSDLSHTNRRRLETPSEHLTSDALLLEAVIDGDPTNDDPTHDASINDSIHHKHNKFKRDNSIVNDIANAFHNLVASNATGAADREGYQTAVIASKHLDSVDLNKLTDAADSAKHHHHHNSKRNHTGLRGRSSSDVVIDQSDVVGDSIPQTTIGRDQRPIHSKVDASKAPTDSYIKHLIAAALAFRPKTTYPKVYYAIFAGRLKFMKIHLQYCNALLELHYVSEVHIWDFTNGHDDDREFITQFIRDTSLPGYRLFDKPQQSTNRQARHNSGEYLWGSFYDHYSTNKRYAPEDVLIKADDDIVFIDVSYFPQFIDSVVSYKDSNLHFPNIVNNDVGFVIQANRMMDNAVLNKWMKYYTSDHGVNFDDAFNSYYHPNHTGKGMTIEPITTWRYGVYKKSDFAHDIHTLFLSDPKWFIQSMHESKLPKVVELKRRISINMYAAPFRTVRKVYRTFLDKFCCDDEAFVGFLPLLSKSAHSIHVDFVISHFAFRAQYGSTASNQALNTILDVYRNSSTIFSSTFHKLLSKGR